MASEFVYADVKIRWRKPF